MNKKSIDEKLAEFKAKIELAKTANEEQQSEEFSEEIENLEKAAQELGEKLGGLLSSTEWKAKAKKDKKRGRGYTKARVEKGRGSKARKKK